MPIHVTVKAIEDCAQAVQAAAAMAPQLTAAASRLADALTDGRRIYICGNGGSASQAQHFAAEFVGRFLIERKPLPAVALTTDTSILTAVGNDYGFEHIFERQARALAQPGDIVWGLSTSGRSPNVLKAFEAAKEIGATTLLMCGPELPGGVSADIVLCAPSPHTPRIQELHLLFGHTLCQLVDHILFETPARGEKK